MECGRINSRRDHAANRDAYLERMKDYAANNRPKINARLRAKRGEDSRFFDYMQTWRQENHDKVIAQQRAWREKNPLSHVIYAQNRRTRKLEAGGEFTVDDVLELVSLQKNKCASCLKKLSAGYHVDHIMPLFRGGTNDKYNLQILCPTCNLKKHAKDPIEWAQKNGRLL